MRRAKKDWAGNHPYDTWRRSSPPAKIATPVETMESFPPTIAEPPRLLTGAKRHNISASCVSAASNVGFGRAKGLKASALKQHKVAQHFACSLWGQRTRLGRAHALPLCSHPPASSPLGVENQGLELQARPSNPPLRNRDHGRVGRVEVVGREEGRRREALPIAVRSRFIERE